MKRHIILLLSLFFAVAYVYSSENGKKEEFTLYSKSFRSGHTMPAYLATLKVKGGKNKSPSLYWKNIPDGTKSFALICIDLHPVAKRWVHWMVINIPAGSDHIVSGASPDNMPEGSVELYNSFGNLGWGGPQPPKGTGLHKYLFKLYALKSEKLPAGISNEKEFNAAVKKAGIAGRAVCYGFFRQD